jgi:hypothetical protein
MITDVYIIIYRCFFRSVIGLKRTLLHSRGHRHVRTYVRTYTRAYADAYATPRVHTRSRYCSRCFPKIQSDSGQRPRIISVIGVLAMQLRNVGRLARDDERTRIVYTYIVHVHTRAYVYTHVPRRSRRPPSHY